MTINNNSLAFRPAICTDRALCSLSCSYYDSIITVSGLTDFSVGGTKVILRAELAKFPYLT